MKVCVAYGLPGSGKTSLLKQLPGKYYDLDHGQTRAKIKKTLFGLGCGVYNLDFLLFRPNDFIDYFFSAHPNSTLVIYKFIVDRNKALLRDLRRKRPIKSTNIIQNMKLDIIRPHKGLIIKEVIK